MDSTASQKRKVNDDDDLQSVTSNASKVCRLDECEEEELAKLESKMSKVSTMCGKLLTNVQRMDLDDPLREVLADLIETVRLTNEVQEEVHNKYKESRYKESRRQEPSTDKDRNYAMSSSMWLSSDFPAPPAAPPPPRYNGNANGNRKKPKGGLVSIAADERGRLDGKNSQQSQKPAETEAEMKLRKFSEAIKEAERSTLCFNLDMGNVPLMNTKTISEKASLALAKMAAQVEGKNGPVPSPDNVAALDDITSMVTNMEFYGSSTKQYKGKDSTGFCTVPVKYQFKDRDKKTFAEKTLRDICKVKCSTPYPAIVRECIKQVVDHVRKSHPADYVRVSVITKEFSLKVARRPPGKDLKWYEYPDLLRLPDEALDVSARKVPEGLRMFFLPSEPQDSMDFDSPKSPRPVSSPGKDKGEKK